MECRRCRAKATTLVAELAQGIHTKRKQRGIPTLAELVEMYSKHLVAQGRRHPQYIGQVYRRCWTSLANRRIDTITSVEIAERHNEIAKVGKVAAARAVKLLRTLYAYANDMELVERNPAKRVRVQDSKPRSTLPQRRRPEGVPPRPRDDAASGPGLLLACSYSRASEAVKRRRNEVG